jgi:hypothetical protein
MVPDDIDPVVEFREMVHSSTPTPPAGKKVLELARALPY